MSQPHFSPAADRNKQHILNTLCTLLPPSGNALELASGTGQHVAWFAAGLPGWTWQPTDAQAVSVDAISATVVGQQLGNVHPALLLDVLAPAWLPAKSLFDVIYCANMLHISPWQTCAALMQGSARHLAPGGRLIIYGPYLEDDVVTSEGNVAFDERLKLENPAWGIRSLSAVQQEAHQAGLHLQAQHRMPAHNLLLVWGRSGV